MCNKDIEKALNAVSCYLKVLNARSNNSNMKREKNRKRISKLQTCRKLIV